MNNHQNATGLHASTLSVHHLVNDMLACYNRVKKDHRRFFINEVPSDMVVPKHQTGPLLSELFAIIASHPAQSPVHITAVGQGHHIKLYAKEPPFPLYCYPGASAA